MMMERRRRGGGDFRGYLIQKLGVAQNGESWFNMAGTGWHDFGIPIEISILSCYPTHYSYLQATSGRTSGTWHMCRRGPHLN